MSEPLRAHEPEDAAPHASHPGEELPTGAAGDAASSDPDDLTIEELRVRAREAAEAEYLVGAVMQREEEKAARRARQENRVRHTSPVRRLMLLALVVFNAYIWMSTPTWLEYRTPKTPPLSYYEGSWKIAVYMQRQRVEEFRREKGRLPAAAKQAGVPVKGVKYTPLQKDVYELRAGNYVKQIVYRSTDSLSVFFGRSLIQMGLIVGGAR